MARDTVDPTLILSSKRNRPVAPRLLDPLNSADEARHVQKRQALEEACQRANEQPEAPTALQNLPAVPVPPAAPLKKRGLTENDSIQSGMDHVLLFIRDLGSTLVKRARTTEEPATMTRCYSSAVEDVEDDEAPVPPPCK
jgi:hypothetical protein